VRIVVIVPYRAAKNRDRQAAWGRVQAEWLQHGFETYAVDDGGEPFSRGASVNRGVAERPGADVYVFADADTLVDHRQVMLAAEAAVHSPGIVLAYNRYGYLTRDGTRQVLDGYTGSWDALLEWSLQGTVSTCIVLSAETWRLTGGFDPRFRGWGMEDVAFEITARTVCGPTRRIPGTAWHLWHPPEPLRPRENVDLLRQYEAADGDVSAVQAVRAAAGDPVRIPRQVHRVWLGPNTPRYDFAEQWQETNPDWELITWRDADVDSLQMVCRAEYDSAPTYVHRADILMCEILYACGGVTVGWDMEPLRHLDPLLAGVNAFCTPDADGFPGQAFMGCVPGHRSMAAVFTKLQRHVRTAGWSPGEPHKDTGPYLWGKTFGRYGGHAASHDLQILGDYCTAYPVRYWEKQYFDNPAVYAVLTRDSYAVHRFQGSWLTDDVRVKQTEEVT
jgi:hypothetical protein